MPFTTQIQPRRGSLADSTADLLVLPVASGDDAPIAAGGAEAVAGLLPAPLDDLFTHYSLTGAPGELVQFPVPRDGSLTRLALLGVGPGSPGDLRKAGAALSRAGRGRERVALAWPGHGADAAAAFAEGVLLASYTFSMKTGETPANQRPAQTVDVVGEDAEALADDLRRGAALAAATALARDLINTPSLAKGPEWMVARAREVASGAGLDVRVWDEKDLVDEGFGAILGVGQGSVRPPRLVRLSYTPENPTEHIVLVGKGITFDTGGLSLKPNDNMKLMKTDMSGAAIVLGVLSELASVGVSVRVTGLLPLAENSFSGSATRVGDVLTTYSGTTVEVLNTDAEGRLVMADAFGYAVAELGPDALVDVATLTGAAKVALGTGIGALYSNDDTIAVELSAAGEQSGEPLWRMPLTDEYAPTTGSRIADLANVGTRGKDFGPAGATEAALFLREFTADVPWAHLDIAGPGRSMSESGVLSKGGTAFTTRTLLRWLASR
ncbi:leucyl aminopeptidase [Nocardiopsis sp. CNT312]|uniref:leucyl aminopeptidase n=1 Tax=Nocardiopsis sp. CNT312 TaxID=1137268 RepID=UPI00048FCD5A|nr:leucyl aminopeptidase [Nocardiopsis sp. CNT312]